MQTNFAALSAAQKKVWSREVWEAARDQMFINKFLGTGEQAMIQRVTELTKTEKGDQCIIQLVADLVEDGVIGDNEREGNEEAMQNYAQTISIDLISPAFATRTTIRPENGRRFPQNPQPPGLLAGEPYGPVGFLFT